MFCDRIYILGGKDIYAEINCPYGAGMSGPKPWFNSNIMRGGFCKKLREGGQDCELQIDTKALGVRAKPTRKARSPKCKFSRSNQIS